MKTSNIIIIVVAILAVWYIFLRPKRTADARPAIIEKVLDPRPHPAKIAELKANIKAAITPPTNPDIGSTFQNQMAE